MSKYTFQIMSLALLLTVGVGGAILGNVQESKAQSSPASLNVGGLSWIEPKSRVIKLGAPNVMEGARVEMLYVEEGVDVTKGQIIGIFSTYLKNEAAYEVALANLILAKADLAKVKAGNKKSDIDSQKQTVQSIGASEARAIKEFKRVEELYDQELASRSQYDIAKAEMDAAIARRKSAEGSLVSLQNVRPDDISIAESKVKVVEAEIKAAKANLDLSVIVAPISGTILTIYARNGEAVSSERGILDIADLSVIDAVTEIDENDILKVAKGQKAEVRITGLDHVIKGTVREIGGQIKRNSMLDSVDMSRMLDTRILDVRVELDPSQNKIVKRLINKKARTVIFISQDQKAK